MDKNSAGSLVLMMVAVTAWIALAGSPAAVIAQEPTPMPAPQIPSDLVPITVENTNQLELLAELDLWGDLEFSSDGAYLYSLCGKGCFWYWHIETGTIQKIGPLDESHDGILRAILSPQRHLALFSGGEHKRDNPRVGHRTVN